MSLKFEWRDRQDGVDDILSEDINSIAHAVIESEEKIENLFEKISGGASVEIVQETGTSETAVMSQKATTDALRERANAVKATASGAKVTIDDISPITHTPRVQLRSRNLIPFPYTFSTKEKNGVTATVNADGSITINGTATANADFGLYNGACYLTAGTYGVRCNGVISNVQLLGEFYNVSSWITGFADATGNGKSFTLNNANVANATRLYICILVKSGATVNNLTIYPMIAKDTIPTEYAPYISDFTGLSLKRYGATEGEFLETYTANADGTVYGVTSIYPVMTLEAGEAATVEVEYNRDLQGALDGKLDKVTATHWCPRAYVVDPDGTQNMVEYSTAPNAYSLAWRASNGTLAAGTPSADSHAVPLGFAEKRYEKTGTTVVRWSELGGDEYIVTDGEYAFGFDVSPANGRIRYNGIFDRVVWRGGNHDFITVSGNEDGGYYPDGVVLTFSNSVEYDTVILKFRELPYVEGPVVLRIEVI